jgi:peptidoglycan/xylan/chitin deacetylase (PgdA/CDA1 family)
MKEPSEQATHVTTNDGVENRDWGSTPTNPGALVISLDFELHWGVRDHVTRDDALYGHLTESRQAVRDLLALFTARGIRATWATVGLLFASSRSELEAHMPSDRPSYARPELNPYSEPIGIDEKHDPAHLAGSLVDLIGSAAGQNVGSHTFSHYYCLEPGQNEATFRADLASAKSIAGARGFELTSLVLPRNQWNPDYTNAVLDLGFLCIRGVQRGWSHQARQAGQQNIVHRGFRLTDTYLGVSPLPTTGWSDVRRPSGLNVVPASAFLRPFNPARQRFEPLRLARLRSGLRQAARRHRIFHLWWHPHNFSQYRSENFALLEQVLDEFDRLADAEGMQSLNMEDVVSKVAQGK